MTTTELSTPAEHLRSRTFRRFDAENCLQAAREQLMQAMKHLDTPETREAHYRAGLAVALADDALEGLS